MKKVFDQTVRDLKREVNKKVLKVPGIEQKVLDATSNEPWGPHGTLLADIAQASRNYHEYQMIMIVVWKRINDTGKNWRHVYKALTVLEYMVANGSERVIDEIREHAYQIQTLSNFQYIDSSGRDQGNNVRRKSQSLVALVNDKERIAEVREKAAANRDKFRSASSAGGMYRPGSYQDARYADEGRGGGRDDDKYDYGRERDWGSRDGDSYRDGDRYGRESEERYGRGSYRDDEYRGRSRSTDNYQYESRSRSSDRERERAYEDDGNYSSRDSGARAEESLERRLERKFSEQNIGAPPSYEEAVSDARSPGLSERNGENQAVPVPKTSPPPVSSSIAPQTNAPNVASPPQQEFETFDEFDPRIPVSAPPATSVSPGVDLFGSDSFNPLALALVDYPTTSEVDPPSARPTFSAPSQPFDDPFGDGPFKANPSTDPAQTASYQSTATQIPKAETVPNYGIAQSPLSDLSYAPPNGNYNTTATPSSGFAPQPLSAPNPNTDMHGGGPLPPSAPASGYHPPQPGYQPPPPHMQAHSNYSQGSFQQQQQGPVVGSSYQVPNYGSSTSQPALTASSGALALVPQQQQQPSKDKFETKSSVWADTLSRGLVDLNISGSKANPMGDIGVDFEALNRKERRMEKSSTGNNNNNTPMSTITMGKAMGSGTGMGRGGAAALRPPMGMGMGMGIGGGAPMGGYRGMMAQQPPPPPMGMGMGMGQMQRPGSGGGYTYSPMMGGPQGGSSYTQQHPYGGGGGGYR